MKESNFKALKYTIFFRQKNYAEVDPLLTSDDNDEEMDLIVEGEEEEIEIEIEVDGEESEDGEEDKEDIHPYCRWNCILCCKSFLMRSRFLRHMANRHQKPFHSRNIYEPNAPELNIVHRQFLVTDDLWSCDECPYQTDSNHELFRHIMKVHFDQTPDYENLDVGDLALVKDSAGNFMYLQANSLVNAKQIPSVKSLPRKVNKTANTACTLKGCSNETGNYVGFFRFPKKNPEQRELWLKAISKVVDLPEGWKPAPNARLCGQHFIQGKPHPSRTSPDYYPTIFPDTVKKKKSK